MYKICKICKQVKYLCEFHKHKEMADGHLNKCKAFTIEYIKQWASKNNSKSNKFIGDY